MLASTYKTLPRFVKENKKRIFLPFFSNEDGLNLIKENCFFISCERSEVLDKSMSGRVLYNAVPGGGWKVTAIELCRSVMFLRLLSRGELVVPPYQNDFFKQLDFPD